MAPCDIKENSLHIRHEWNPFIRNSNNTGTGGENN